jgi:HSP20 family protein
LELLLRFDPFRDLDRLADQMLGSARTPRMMPMDAYRSGHQVVLHFDLPGIDPDSVDLTVENNALSVRAERSNRTVGDDAQDVQWLVSERPTGSFTRQLVLGEGLDTENIRASYEDGVLTVIIPVAEQAKPRRIEVSRQEDSRVIAGETGS